MSFITAISSLTCHGEDLWTGLNKKPQAPHFHSQLGDFPAFKIPQFREELFNKKVLEELILHSISQTLSAFSVSEKQKKWGVILASTKGWVEDFIWQEEACEYSHDPFNIFLTSITQQLPINIINQVTVSNACASSHSALAFGQRWITRGDAEHVLVLAFDIIGPFIQKGFSALHALSSNHQVKPFDEKRDGLILGDGIASCVLSEKPCGGAFSLSPVSVICEGHSLTRPQSQGEALYRALQQTTKKHSFDGILAHGTGTFLNDKSEDQAFKKFLTTQPQFITANKWSVGHTLGASGLTDLAAACEMIKRQKVTGIQTLESSSLEMSELYLKKPLETKLNSILISSLGFGGVNAAMVVGEVP